MNQDLFFFVWKGVQSRKKVSYNQFADYTISGWKAVAYTGIHAKNGEIKNYDILEDTYGYQFEVEYCKEHDEFALKHDDLLCNVSDIDEWVILGNRLINGMTADEKITY